MTIPAQPCGCRSISVAIRYLHDDATPGAGKRIGVAVVALEDAPRLLRHYSRPPFYVDRTDWQWSCGGCNGRGIVTAPRRKARRCAHCEGRGIVAMPWIAWTGGESPSKAGTVCAAMRKALFREQLSCWLLANGSVPPLDTARIFWRRATADAWRTAETYSLC